jgi:hypothetical protein
MDTRVFCVYNLARGVFVSSKVTVADTASEPLRMLSVLVGSMAQDGEAGLWLTPLYGVPSVPRLFPFDLAYLDKDHRVLESVEVLHGVRFPCYSPEVASALVLPLRSLVSTKTQQGDRLIVCPQEDMERQLAATEELVLAATEHIPGQSKNGSDGELTARNECSSPAPALDPSGDSAVQAEPQPDGALAAETTVPTAAQNGGHKSDAVSGPAEPTSQHDKEAAKRAAYRPRWEELIEEQVARGGGAHEEVRTPEPVGQASSAASDSEPVKLPDGTTGQTPGAVTVDAISKAEPEPTKIAPTQNPPGYEDPGDIFANWVAAPFAAPAWLEPKLEPSRRSRSDAAATTSQPGAPEKRTVDAQPTVSDPDNVSASSSDSHAEAADLPPDPLPTTVPASPQATAFTVAQYGMWRVSAATTGGPVPGTELTQTTSSKSAPTNGAETEGPAPKESKLEGAGADRVPSPGATRGFSEGVAAKSEREKRPQDTVPLVQPAPSSKSAPAANSDSAMAAVPAQNVVREVAERSVAAKQAIPDRGVSPKLADLRSERRQLAKDATPEGVEPETAVPAQSPAQTKNGTPASQPEANGSTQKAADALTMTVPLPGFLKPEQKGQQGKLKISIQRVSGNAKGETGAGSLMSRFQRWLKPVAPPSDRRRAHRRYVPGVAAYYFTGGSPKPHEVADISMSGFFLITDDHWMPGTMIQMTLQKPCARGERKQSIAVLAKIVRRASDGVGAEFVMPETLDQHGHAVPPERTTDRFSLARFL